LTSAASLVQAVAAPRMRAAHRDARRKGFFIV
jgi:hypothetical protein